MAVFFISFGVYLHTLLPSVGYSGDTAKFQFIGKLLDIPHSPGYPFYVVISHFFGKLPIATLAYRLNLMSAFFASLTLVCLFLLIRQLVHNWPIALLSALSFGFSQTFWSQAVVAEVYTLHTCFLAVVMLFLFLWAQTKKTSYFYLACLLYAISFGNHLLMITVLPAFVVFVVMTDYRILLSKKRIAVVLACIVVGMLQYVLVFIRLESPSPELLPYRAVWHYSGSFADRLYSFFNFVTAKAFRSSMFAFSPEELIRQRIPMFFALFRENFSLWGIIAGGIGIGTILKSQRNSALLLLLIIFGNLFYALNYDIKDVFVYFIPTYLVFSVCIGYFAWSVANIFSRFPYHLLRSCQYFVVLLALGGLGWKLVITNYPIVDQSHNTYEELFTTTVLEQLDERSIVLLPQEKVENYHWTMYYFYQIFGAEKRQDAPLPLPPYFFSSVSSPPIGQFPFSFWQSYELKNYLQQQVAVYAQAEVDTLRAHGYLLQKVIFQQGKSLMNFLQNLPAPCLLLLSVKLQGTRALTADVSRVLTRFGLSQSQKLLDKPFHSYAAIGVKQEANGHFSGIEVPGFVKVGLTVKKGDAIGTSHVVAPSDIEISSNGLDEKDVNEIRVDGKNYSHNQRGMNIVVLHAETGEVLYATSFPTHLSLYQDEVVLWKVSGTINDTAEMIFTEEPDEEMRQFWRLKEGTIDLTNREHRKYLLGGWTPTKRWGTGAQLPSEIIFYIPEQQEMRLTLEFMPGSLVFPPEHGEGDMYISLNGTRIETMSLPPADIESLLLPAHILRQGFNLLELQPAAAASGEPGEKQHPRQDSWLIGLKKLSFSQLMATEPE